MIYVGIDDTDTLDSPGTNQLARALIVRVAAQFRCVFILRHQLLFDPRIPYTNKNGSASIQLQPLTAISMEQLVTELRTRMCEWFIEGSDPGLCVTEQVPPAVVAFGQRCQREIVCQADARALAAAHGIHLEGLGGTEGGVIGALAAVGLAATGNDGRVVQLGTWPEDLSGEQPVAAIQARHVEIVCQETGQPVTAGMVDVRKHLRPNRRAGKVVLYVVPASTDGSRWEAVRLT